MRKWFLQIYYLVLILLLVLYTNMDNSPNMVIRLGYMAALIVPLLRRVELLPVVIICTLGIAKNTFAYPLLPTDYLYYIFLALIFALIASFHRGFKVGFNPMLFFALVYLILNDIALENNLSDMTIVLIIYILFFMCMDCYNNDTVIKLLPQSFIIISLAISYWAQFCPEAQINTYNKVEDMNQTGWTDPNYLSAVLGTGLVVAVSELFYGINKRLYTLVLVLTVFSSSIAMVTLASRGAILSVIMAIFIIFVFSKTKKRTKLIAVSLAALLVLFLFTNQYMELVMTRFEISDQTGTHRTEIWQSKLNDFLALDNPINWLIGVGHSKGMELGLSFGEATEGMSTHNDFLSIFLYYGLIGFVIYSSVVTYVIKMSTKGNRPQIIALLVYLLMCSMTIEPLARGNFVYWGLFFYIIMLARRSHAIADHNCIIQE